MAPDDLQVTSPSQFRRNNTKVVQITKDLVIRIQRHDLPGLVLQGVLPLTLFQASLRFRELQEKKEEDATESGIEGQLRFLDRMRETGFLTFLQKYACITVIEPVIVMDRDDNEEHLWVGELDLEQLMKIHEVGMGYDGLPHVSRAAAEEFRGPTAPAPSDAAPAGKRVRSKPELVDSGTRETITA